MPYWDTSCLLKLYVVEQDSLVFKTHALAVPSIICSEIVRLEFLATVRRKEAAGDLAIGGWRTILKEFDADVAAGLIELRALDSAVKVEFETIVEHCYQRTSPILLRTLDAIHLATAVAESESQVVTTDKRLREAALATGYSVFPP
jgi:predicted nucleic acid-binding protein